MEELFINHLHRFREMTGITLIPIDYKYTTSYNFLYIINKIRKILRQKKKIEINKISAILSDIILTSFLLNEEIYTILHAGMKKEGRIVGEAIIHEQETDLTINYMIFQRLKTIFTLIREMCGIYRTGVTPLYKSTPMIIHDIQSSC